MGILLLMVVTWLASFIALGVYAYGDLNSLTLSIACVISGFVGAFCMFGVGVLYEFINSSPEALQLFKEFLPRK